MDLHLQIIHRVCRNLIWIGAHDDHCSTRNISRNRTCKDRGKLVAFLSTIVLGLLLFFVHHLLNDVSRKILGDG
jgi:hypothetical protein